MDMLEKAARALAKAEARGRVDLYANNPELYIRLARAVLLAIREPDEGEVTKAGRDYAQSAEAHQVSWTRMANGTFTAMIDAILAVDTNPQDV